MGDKNIRLLTPSDNYSPTVLALLLGGFSEIHGAEKVSVDSYFLWFLKYIYR
jgi:hypothetical protein